MQIVELDFNGCKFISSIHDVLKKAFKLPEYYGNNLDALRDCLEYYCDYDLQVNIRGISNLPKEFDDYIFKMRVVFNEVSKTSPNITFSFFS